MQNPNLDINFINFNQDSTSLGIGTRTGYKLFSMSSLDKLELIYESACRDVIIVERLFSSSLLALVSLTSPRKLRVCHFKKGTEICQYSYSNTILAVKLNRCRIRGVCLLPFYHYDVPELVWSWLLKKACTSTTSVT